MDMRGATFIGAAFSDHPTVTGNVFNVGTGQPQACLDDLKAAIADARADLVGAASGEARTEVDRRLGQIEDELAEEAAAAGPVVRSRWDKVVTVLEPLGTVSGHLAKITELITNVFSGS